MILVIVLVGTAPFWAPALPWSTPPAPEAAPRDDAALNQRLDRLDASQQQMRQQTTGAAATLQQLDRRLAAIEAKPPPPPPDTSGIRQQLTSLSGASAALAARVDALDKSVRSRNEHDTTDMSLVLALLQIRDAVDAGRPFDAEYGALTTLARSRPDVVTAAAPLAEPARTGTASRAVLTRRLRELGGEIAATEAPPAASEGWFGEAWARVRGLIRIRRIDGAAPGGSPDAAVNAAELSLAGGDLEGAVTALGKLDGAAAEAAGPWLRQARQRIAVEAALHRIESLLLAGGPSGASSGTSPGAPPAPPPAMGSAH
ncbi:MAG TPA: mitofilin family membrane protein [Stellaceae bacterium]|nr:mitofilin family membrane protein [Stellaceae bacterium]